MKFISRALSYLVPPAILLYPILQGLSVLPDAFPIWPFALLIFILFIGKIYTSHQMRTTTKKDRLYVYLYMFLTFSTAPWLINQYEIYMQTMGHRAGSEPIWGYMLVVLGVWAVILGTMMYEIERKRKLQQHKSLASSKLSTWHYTDQSSSGPRS